MNAGYAIIVGVGPGAGAAIARRFAKAYTVMLLARKSESFDPVVKQIKNDGGQAFGFQADVTSRASLQDAMKAIEKQVDVQSHCAVRTVDVRFRQLINDRPQSSMPVLVQHRSHFSRLPKRSWLMPSPLAGQFPS